MNPKTKPAVYSNMVEWTSALGDVLVAIYEFYGYDPKIWTKEMVVTCFFLQLLQMRNISIKRNVANTRIELLLYLVHTSFHVFL